MCFGNIKKKYRVYKGAKKIIKTEIAKANAF